jgi:hypothetical protein
MPHTGEELGADLADLYNAGRFKLTALADEFSTAATNLFNVGATDGLFARHPQLNGSLGSVKGPWDDLHDQIVGLLKETTANLQDTGTALMMAAEEYASTDAAAEKVYREIRGRLDAENGVTS